jgi:hypothetical protein
MESAVKKNLIYIAIVLVSLAACKGQQHEKEIGEIAGIRGKLHQTDSVLALTNSDEAERFATEVRNNSQYVQFNINKIKDSLDFKTGLFLANYYDLLRRFESVAKGNKKLGQAVDSTLVNLDNLEHDLQNNTLAKEITPESAVERETEQANELYEHAVDLRSLFVKTKAGYDTLAPKMITYMAELNIRMAGNEPGANPK